MSDTSTPFTDVLWDAAQGVYDAIIRHPYMQELVAGSLPVSKFSHYLVQDFHFLQVVARAFHAAAPKARNDEWILMFNQVSTEVLVVERSLHEEFFKELGISLDTVRDTPMAPTSEGYASALLVAAYQDSFPEALAALLPCFWVYQNLGQHLLSSHIQHPMYRRWAEFYGGEDYSDMIEGVLELVDQVGAHVDVMTRNRMVERFVHFCRYEWLFWQMSYTEERWPDLGA